MTGPEACGHLGDVLSALIDGELDDAVAERVKAHLARCPTCRRERARTIEAHRVLAALPHLTMPAEILDRLDTGSPIPPAPES